MPLRGRVNQSVDAMRRLMETASYPARYIAVGGTGDLEVIHAVAQVKNVHAITATKFAITYWEALKFATDNLPASTLVVNTANDVLPVIHWLRNAVEMYDVESSLARDKVVGFNGDGHGINHACHFMISMARVRKYGGWPIWYSHNFGDTEICTRAMENTAFIKAPYAILFHNHPAVSRSQTDAVYDQGNANFMRDKHTFTQRKENGWSFITPY